MSGICPCANAGEVDSAPDATTTPSARTSGPGRNAMRIMRLPDQFDAELQLARSGRERRDLTGEAHRRTFRVEQFVVRQRRRKVRTVRRVEQLDADLHVCAIAEAADPKVLDQRQVRGDETRTDQGVSPGISEPGARIRKREAIQLDV